MTNIALFPGQGSQKLGMGSDLQKHSATARHVFEEVSDVLGYNITHLMEEGPAETLQLTEYAQPAIMSVSIASWRCFIEYYDKDIASFVSAVAGHSLGEYSALCAIGVLSLHDTAKILQERGRAMQNAVPNGEGAMAAMIGSDSSTVSQIVEQANQHAQQGQIVAIANDNAVGQIVISGSKPLVEYAISIAKDYGIKKSVLLPVSAPFHCSLMQKASQTMLPLLQNIAMQEPIVPIYSNITAQATNNSKDIRQCLCDQICGQVRWRETMEHIAQDFAVEHIYEFGEGNVLTSLAKRVFKNATMHNIASVPHE